MSKAIVNQSMKEVNPFSDFKAKVKQYAQAVEAESFNCSNDGDLFTATIYGPHKVKLCKRPHSDSCTARLYLGERNVKTVELHF